PTHNDSAILRLARGQTSKYVTRSAILQLLVAGVYTTEQRQQRHSEFLVANDSYQTPAIDITKAVFNLSTTTVTVFPSFILTDHMSLSPGAKSLVYFSLGQA